MVRFSHKRAIHAFYAHKPRGFPRIGVPNAVIRHPPVAAARLKPGEF